MQSGDISPFERYARLYDLVMPGASARTLRAGLDRAERPVERVVDIAGGSGRATVAIDAPERIVLDAAGEMLQQARKRGLQCVQGDASRLPLADDCVDAITIVDALHHVYDWAAVFSEVERVLAPGGVFVVSDFDPTTVLGRILDIGEQLVGFDSQFATPEALADQLAEAGFASSVVEHGFAYTVAGVVTKTAD